MSEETGQKPTEKIGEFKVNVTLDWDNKTVSVIPQQAATIGELLQALLFAYNAVMEQGKELLDEEKDRIVH